MTKPSKSLNSNTQNVMNFMKLSWEQLAYGINTGCSGVCVTPCNVTEEATASVLNPEDRGGKLTSLKMSTKIHAITSEKTITLIVMNQMRTVFLGLCTIYWLNVLTLRRNVLLASSGFLNCYNQMPR